MQHLLLTCSRDAERRAAAVLTAGGRGAVERAVYIDRRCVRKAAVDSRAEAMQHLLFTVRRETEDDAEAMRAAGTRRAVERAAYIGQPCIGVSAAGCPVEAE